MRPILCWNCCGLGNSTTIASLTDLVRHYSPSFVFLSKTKCSGAVIKRIQQKKGLDNGVWVDPIGKAGSLALIWSKEEEISLRSMSSRFIDVSIRHFSGEHWRFTGIYGWADHGHKHNTWDLIKKFGGVTLMKFYLLMRKEEATPVIFSQ